MIEIIKNLLKQIIDDLDCNNSTISEKEQIEIIDLIQKINRQDLSKTESANYIGVSRATFDNYVKKGLLPEGKKRQGFKELSWSKYDLNKFLENGYK